jgi:hypothetical protein
LAVRVAVVLPFLAVVALSAYEGVQHRDSTGAHAGVIVIVAVAVVAMIVAGVLRHRSAAASDPLMEADGSVTTRSRAMVIGSTVWVVLFAAVVGWDAFSFSQQSGDTPSMSQLIGHVTQFHVGRAVLFGVWVAAGWLLATAKPGR